MQELANEEEPTEKTCDAALIRAAEGRGMPLLLLS
jgi:hypothetical protein